MDRDDTMQESSEDEQEMQIDSGQGELPSLVHVLFQLLSSGQPAQHNDSTNTSDREEYDEESEAEEDTSHVDNNQAPETDLGEWALIPGGDGHDRSSSSSSSSSSSDEFEQDTEHSNRDMRTTGNSMSGSPHKRTRAPLHISFDRALPATHHYLGQVADVDGTTTASVSPPPSSENSSLSNLENQNSQPTPPANLAIPGTVLILPLIPLPGVVLLPGQTLPLRLVERRHVDIINRILREAVDVRAASAGAAAEAVRRGQKILRTFAVVNRLDHLFVDDVDLPLTAISPIGTTAEIKSVRRLDEDNSMNVVSRGKQRFRIRRLLREGRILLAEVCILDEGPARLPLLVDRFSNRKNKHLRQSVDRTSVATWCPWWTWHAVDPARLAQCAVERLSAMSPEFQRVVSERTSALMSPLSRSGQSESPEPTGGHTATPATTGPGNDAVAVSYWLATNLPLEDALRQSLLEAPCATARLLMELELMDKMDVIRCRGCRTTLARRKDIITLSLEGAVGAYVNPHGWVHEIVTLRKVARRALLPVGQPSTDSSWFPGYAWTIVYCSTCAAHLGWRYDAVAPERTQPAVFWGLRRHGMATVTVQQER